MASAFTHAIAASALVTCAGEPRLPRRVWIAALVSAVIPDLDVIGFRFGVPYESMFGHRGFTHSIPFAAAWALVLVAALFRDRGSGASRLRLWAILFFSTASHGVLDAFTDGGGGVGFFAPFSSARFFFPWRPLAVSPLSVRAFFSARGVRILRTEITWVWFPAAAVVCIALLVRRLRRSPPTGAG
jgi:inner membrane protein